MLRNYPPTQGRLRLAGALRRGPGLQWAADLLLLSILPAENHALGEIANQRVNALIAEDRLDLEPVRALLDPAYEVAARALQCLVT